MMKHVTWACSTGAPSCCRTVPPSRGYCTWSSERRARPLHAPGRGEGGTFQRLSAAIPVERSILHGHSKRRRHLPDSRPRGPGATQRTGRDAGHEGEPEQRGGRSDCGRYSSEEPTPDGVLRSEVRLNEGLYTVTIATEKQNLMQRPQYLIGCAYDRLSEAGTNRGRSFARRAARGLTRVQTLTISQLC